MIPPGKSECGQPVRGRGGSQRSSVLVCDSFCDRQTQSETACRSGARFVGAVETLEQPRQLLRRDIFAPVRHIEDIAALSAVQFHLYFSAADGMENAASITVRFSDGRELQARRLGSDRVSGVCLLKVEARDLPTAAFAPEAQVRVGQNVYCVCNPYGTQVPNVFCAGMVSASRSVELGGSEFQLLQAAFLPQGADCGSPILDGRGNVLGIVTPIGEKLVSGSDPGFAVSARDLERIVSALDGQKDGTRNWLGLELSEIPEDIRVFLGYPKGLWIESVGTDTAPYGVLYSYDVVTALDGVELSDLAVYEQLMAEHAPGDTVRLTIYRNHRWYTVNLPVISR